MRNFFCILLFAYTTYAYPENPTFIVQPTLNLANPEVGDQLELKCQANENAYVFWQFMVPPSTEWTSADMGLSGLEELVETLMTKYGITILDTENEYISSLSIIAGGNNNNTVIRDAQL